MRKHNVVHAGHEHVGVAVHDHEESLLLANAAGVAGRSKPLEDHADSVASKPEQVAHAEYNELWAALG